MRLCSWPVVFTTMTCANDCFRACCYWDGYLKCTECAYTHNTADVLPHSCSTSTMSFRASYYWDGCFQWWTWCTCAHPHNKADVLPHHGSASTILFLRTQCSCAVCYSAHKRWRRHRYYCSDCLGLLSCSALDAHHLSFSLN
jgi:hypothetical protein